jgi:hypothetical protein
VATRSWCDRLRAPAGRQDVPGPAAADRVNDHRVVFFNATQQAEAVELDRFARALQPAFADEPLLGDGVTLRTWERALQAVAAVARREPVVVIIDEAIYLAQSTPGFASIVQAIWDSLQARAEPTRLTLILTGSASTVMEDMVGPGGPLRGRATHHLRLKPFDLPTVARISTSHLPTPSRPTRRVVAGRSTSPHGIRTPRRL